jgi:hypothetical protein
MYMCDFLVKNWCKIETGMSGTVLQSNIRQLVKTAKNRSILFSAVRKKTVKNRSILFSAAREKPPKIGPYYFRRFFKIWWHP